MLFACHSSRHFLCPILLYFLRIARQTAMFMVATRRESHPSELSGRFVTLTQYQSRHSLTGFNALRGKSYTRQNLVLMSGE